MQQYGYGRTVEDAVADLFRPQTRKAVSECDRLRVNMMRYRDRLDDIERQISSLEAAIRRQQRVFRDAVEQAVASAAFALIGLLAALRTLRNAVSVLRGMLRERRPSRADIAAIILALTPFGSAVNALFSARAALRAHDYREELEGDLGRLLSDAGRVRDRLGDAATRLQQTCQTDRNLA